MESAAFHCFNSESLDELTEMSVNLFGDVKNKNVPVPEWKDHPYGPEQLKVCSSDKYF